MDEQLAFLRRIDEPTFRRSWLLYRALECLPLDQAIDLARTADAFITGEPVERKRTDGLVLTEPKVTCARGANRPLAPAAATRLATAATTTAPKPISSALPQDVRQQVVDRLASGARNKEIAAEFGLTPKQVQGVRMGCTREITKRRGQHERQEPISQSRTVAASIDEVVRYLRQQDDVVVRQESGEFLVNARFRLPFTELVNRANRMRMRQGKAEFDLGEGQPLVAEATRSANGQSLFWSTEASILKGQ
jgi:hypothetical protein